MHPNSLARTLTYSQSKSLHIMHDKVRLTPVTGSFGESRCKDWIPLIAGEILVWIGIILYMVTLGRARASHY